MDNEHIPVDHKDDTGEYRKQVWDAVQQRVGAELTQLAAGATFEGMWDVDFDMMGTRQPMFRYNFVSDTSVEISSPQDNAQAPTAETYSVPRDGQLIMSGETYHAAMTNQGEFVLFNGDSSLVLIATKTAVTE